MSRYRLVSVLITSHDYARYLPEAVDGALAQTYPRTEVVVVDDGSTDGSREILEAYGPHVRLCFTENRGQAAALNAGFAAARGEIVLLLDADDRLHPDAARAVAAAWRPGAVRAQFPVELVSADGAYLGVRLPGSSGGAGMDARGLLLSEGRYPATGTTGAAYGRDVLERILPIPAEDWRRYPDVYLQVLAPFFGEVVWLDEVLGEVRLHGENSWSLADEVRPQRLRDHLECDARQDALLRSWAPRLGFSLPDDWLTKTPNHLQARLASLRWEPERHPYRDDRRSRLGLAGARSALASARLGRGKGLGMAIWFIALAVAPQRFVPGLVEAGFLPSRRPRLFRSFPSLSGAGSAQRRNSRLGTDPIVAAGAGR